MGARPRPIGDASALGLIHELAGDRVALLAGVVPERPQLCGTHVHVSRKHLPKYLAEFAVWYNHRHVADQMFARMIGAMA